MTSIKSDAPGAMATRRLFDARKHWSRASAAYFSPDDFRIEINACIQALRNVTFALQADKGRIPNFDKWYGGWQERMRADSKMKWSVEARNRIVKARDLELHSVLRASLVGSYLEHEVPSYQVADLPKSTTTSGIVEELRKGLPEHFIKNSQLKIERRWVIAEFPNDEFLELLVHCWTFLARILQPDVLSNAAMGGPPVAGWGSPPCMVKDDEARCIWIKTATGEVTHLASDSVQLADREILDRVEYEAAATRYGIRELAATITGSTVHDRAHRYFEVARRMLMADGYHMFIVMLFTASKQLMLYDMRPEDQSDKYRMWRMIAAEVKRVGAESLICISEVWTATIRAGEPIVHAAEASNRGEALQLLAASSDCSGLALTASFTRDGDKILLQETHEDGIESVNALAPVLLAWREMAAARNIGD